MKFPSLPTRRHEFVLLTFLALAGGIAARGATYSWTPTAAATFSWNDAANWGGAAFPSAVGDVANVTSALTNNQETINLNQAITVGSLTLGNGNGSLSGPSNRGNYIHHRQRHRRFADFQQRRDLHPDPNRHERRRCHLRHRLAGRQLANHS